MHRIEENLTAFLTVFFRGLFYLMGCLCVLLLKITLTYCSLFLLLLLGAGYKTNDEEEDDLLGDQVGSDPEYGVNFLTSEQDGGLDPNGSYK